MAEPGWIALRRLGRESGARAIVITLLVCTVCSAAITSAVTLLRPYQELHRASERAARVEQIVGSVPGIGELLGPLGGAQLEARVVELSSGRYLEGIDAAAFDARRAAADPATSIALPAERDLAGIGRRALHASVFLVFEAGELRLLVLPVYGAGYVSTLYGYLALDADLNTVRGLSFYEHGETPGLGAEIDNHRWRALWQGKRLRDAGGALRIGVARRPLEASDPDAPYLVDGISGATRTGVGVTQMLRFWVGPDGFGPYLDRLREKRGDT